jgi:hypothetical protein
MRRELVRVWKLKTGSTARIAAPNKARDCFQRPRVRPAPHQRPALVLKLTAGVLDGMDIDEHQAAEEIIIEIGQEPSPTYGRLDRSLSK